MVKYTAIYKGNVYNAEIGESVYGDYQLTISRSRQGKKPKVCFTNLCKSRFGAMIKLESYIPDLSWKEDTR